MADNQIEEIKKLHEEFKSALERHDEAATKRLNDALSDLEDKSRKAEAERNRPGANVDAVDARETEYKSAFEGYLRTGDKSALAAFPEFHVKANSASVSSEGGYTVPKQIYNDIQKTLVDISPVRQVARVLQAATPDFHIPFTVGGTNSGWVAEKDARPNTASTVFTEIVPAFGELYARPVVTQQLIEDSQFDIPGFIAGEVNTEFARNEGLAFLKGTGVKQPVGLMTAPSAVTGDATRAYGTVQYVPTGVAAALSNGSNNGVDALINLVMSLKAGFRAGAAFMMTKETLGVVRSLKDATGRYLWQPAVEAGVPSTLLDYPVYEAQDMDQIAANTQPIVFGNFQAAYTICDRIGMSMMVDNVTQWPYVQYNVRKRVGGNLVDTQALKYLKVSAS